MKSKLVPELPLIVLPSLQPSVLATSSPATPFIHFNFPTLLASCNQTDTVHVRDSLTDHTCTPSRP